MGTVSWRKDRGKIMEQPLLNLFWIIVFPGFIFTVVAGFIVYYIVRKATAWVQWRVGPPVTQPFWDVMKLMGKEILIPTEANRSVFIGAPIVGMAGVLLLSTMLWRIVISGNAYIGDIIVAIYLMVIPSLALILGSSASASPHAAIGTSREMKLVISYELPLVLAIIVAIIRNDGVLSLAAINQSPGIWSISNVLAFIISLLCVQAKLGFIPFDIAESETELASGVLIEYSGALLAIWKLMQTMMIVALPLFLVIVFMGGFATSGWPLAASIGKYVAVVVLIVLIKNTNPRVRIDQAMKFFWVYCGIIMVIAVILAAIGNAYDIAWL